MLERSAAFSGFSTNDLETTKDFYTNILGLRVEDNSMDMLNLYVTGRDTPIIIYPKDDHQPASYTILNFPVSRIDEAVDDLTDRGVVFEHYDGMTDEKGIAWGLQVNRGPNIAWFKDPAGNILSVVQEH